MRRYAASVVLRSPAGRVLLLRRADGTWSFPGGFAKVEDGGSSAETALRELREETGFRGALRFWYPQALVTTRWQDGVVHTTLAADAPREFPVELSDEHTDSGWFPPNAVPRPLHRGVSFALREAGASGILRRSGDD